MGMWQAYVDGSGNREHSPLLVLGGFIATAPQWESFVYDWQEMLDAPPHIKYFKMAEAGRRREQFNHFTESERDAKVAHAYAVAEKHASFQVSCVVHLEPFYRLFTEAEFEKSAREPFYLAFSAIISNVARHQSAAGLSGEVDFIFDNEAMFKDKIMREWDRFKTEASPDVREFIGDDPAFRDDLKVLPLQAADLIAWWVRKMATVGADSVQFPWKPKRALPGFQFNYDEAQLLKVRDTIRGRLREEGG
jgi:hypothetical protein